MQRKAGNRRREPIRYVVEHVYSGKESMEKVLTAVSEEAAKEIFQHGGDAGGNLVAAEKAQKFPFLAELQNTLINIGGHHIDPVIGAYRHLAGRVYHIRGDDV